MKFVRTTYNEDRVLIVKHPRNEDLYTVIPHSYKQYQEFNLHKNYVKKIFGKKKDFLSEYEDESSYKIWTISWDEKDSSQYGTNIIIKTASPYDDEDEDE